MMANMMHYLMLMLNTMRTTVTIEVSLYKKALEVADPAKGKADLFREAVKDIRQNSGAQTTCYLRRIYAQDE
jgi:hypothetical protein